MILQTLSNHRYLRRVLSAFIILIALCLRISAHATFAAYSVWLQLIGMPSLMNSITDIVRNIEEGFLKIMSMLSVTTFINSGPSILNFVTAVFKYVKVCENVRVYKELLKSLIYYEGSELNTREPSSRSNKRKEKM